MSRFKINFQNGKNPNFFNDLKLREDVTYCYNRTKDQKM